jgi:hypothetical protein
LSKVSGDKKAGIAQSRDEFVCSGVAATHKFIPTVTNAKKRFFLESLRDSILIGSEQVGVDLFRFNEWGNRELTPSHTGQAIQLTTIDVTFPIELLYEKLNCCHASNAILIITEKKFTLLITKID